MQQVNQRGLLYVSVFVAALFLATLSGTFAYFQVSASNSNKIVGNIAGNNLVLTITSPTNLASGPLIPLNSTNSTFLQKAVNGTNSTPCQDSNGYVVCQIYTVTITNSSNTPQRLIGNLILSASSAPNMKWGLMTSATAVKTTTTPVSVGTVGNLATDLTLEAGNSQSYYVLVWLNETGSAQTDGGSFTGTVTFTSYVGKNLTATFS